MKQILCFLDLVHFFGYFKGFCFHCFNFCFFVVSVRFIFCITFSSFFGYYIRCWQAMNSLFCLVNVIIISSKSTIVSSIFLLFLSFFLKNGSFVILSNLTQETNNDDNNHNSFSIINNNNQ